jgi:hypothetical protein
MLGMACNAFSHECRPEICTRCIFAIEYKYEYEISLKIKSSKYKVSMWIYNTKNLCIFELNTNGAFNFDFFSQLSKSAINDFIRLILNFK